MAFFDDEDEEETGPLAVARAMSSDDTGAAPDAMPDTTAKTQPVKQDPATSVARGLQEDGGAQVLADYPYDEPDELKGIDSSSTDASQEPTAKANSPEEESDQGVAAIATAQPYTVPTAPTLKPYSGANIEAAQQLANAKTDFAGKVSGGAYKPSVGRRIASALAGGLVGFGSRNAAEGIEAAQGMRNRPLAEAKRNEAAKESGIQSQIDAGNLDNQRIQQENAQSLQNYNLQEHDFRNKAYAEHQNALAAQEQATAQSKLNEPVGFVPNDPSNPYAGGTVTTRSGKQVPNSAPPKGWIPEWAKTPAGQAATATMTVHTRQKLAADMGLNPQETKFFLANGKLAEPSQHTTISIRENPDGSPVQPRPARGSGAPPQNNISDIVAKATQDKQAFIDGYQRVGANDANELAPEGYYVKGTQVISPDEMHARIEKFRTDANVKLNKYGAHLDEQGQLHTEPGQPQLTPGAPAAAAPQKPVAPAQQPANTFQYKGQTFSKGQKVLVGGQPHTVVGLNPQTGKLMVQ